MRVVLLLGLLVPIGFAASQTTIPGATPDGAIRTYIEGINIPPISNAPFTAKVVVNWDQPLIGGGTISRKYFTLVARDSAGRVHRETRDFIAADSNAEPHLRSFSVTDPVASTRITCTPDATNCTIADLSPALAPTQTSSTQATPAKGFSRQDLGQQTLNALPVVGSRETTTSTVGPRGNSRILVSTKELWYSPDLQMYLSVIRRDPQLGQLTLTVTDLMQGEPDASWFGVPVGYTFADARSRATTTPH